MLDGMTREKNNLGDLPVEVQKAVSSAAAEKRINVLYPDQHFPSQVLSASQLVFSPGSSLILGHSSMDWVAVIADEIILPGNQSQVTLASHTSMAAKKPMPRSPGKPGIDAAASGELHGGEGHKAKKSKSGMSGDNSPSMIIVAKKVTFLHPPRVMYLQFE